MTDTKPQVQMPMSRDEFVAKASVFRPGNEDTINYLEGLYDAVVKTHTKGLRTGAFRLGELTAVLEILGIDLFLPFVSEG